MTFPSPTDRPRTSGEELRQRIVWAAILAVVALGIAVVGGWLATVALAVVAGLVAREWATVAVAAAPLAALLLPVLAAVPVLVAGTGSLGAAVLVAVCGAGIAGLVLKSGWAAAGVVYAAALGIALEGLRSDPAAGLEAVFFVLAAVWGADTGAYLVGRGIGGPKLWPRVSPNKTWSGFIGGTLVGAAAGLSVAAIAGYPIRGPLVAVAIGLALASAGGDLFESAVKRRFHAKDAGTLIPGHGGIMDRVDGLAFASVAAAFVGWLTAGAPDLGQGLLLW